MAREEHLQRLLAALAILDACFRNSHAIKPGLSYLQGSGHSLLLIKPGSLAVPGSFGKQGGRCSGDWESDLVCEGNHQGFFVMIVERKSRFTLIGHVVSKTAEALSLEGQAKSRMESHTGPV